MDSAFMKEALNLAKKAASLGEVPVGAVVVKDKKIISGAFNTCESDKNFLAHAEIKAINGAIKVLGEKSLDGCEIYVTLEPCEMCMGAILNARIDTLVFGAYDLEKGFADSKVNSKNLLKSKKPEIFGGIFEDECKKLLKNFFGAVR